MGGDGDFDVPALKAKLLGCLGSDAHVYPARLERDFPRILARIVELWGRAELDAYLQGLMVSDRTDRQGFPPEVAMELFRLATVHGALGLAPDAGGTGWAGLEDAELYKKSVQKKDD